MSKFIQNSFLKLQNLGKLASQGGAKDTNENDSYELSSTSDPAVSTLDIKTVLNLNSMNLKDFIDYFDSPDLKQELENQQSVLVLKMQVSGLYDDLDSEVLENLSEKCLNKSIVISIKLESCDKVSIYWKSKDVQQFITLRYYGEEFTENDRKIYAFVADYLASSLSRGQLGTSLIKYIELALTFDVLGFSAVIVLNIS
ncbi:hypothetical protein ACKWTF_015080 [Chironomus riparius]